MSYFLGIFPDDKSNKQIKNVVGEVGKIFKDFGIPVRWVEPQTYHITQYYIGEKISPLKRYLITRKLKKLTFKPFKVRLNNIKLGISRNYKELIYMDLVEGGDTLRNMYLEIKSTINTNDVSKFVPHLTIGRVSKDLSEEEQRNINKDLSNVCESLKIQEITFDVYELSLVENKDGNYSLLMKFEASSKTLL